MANKTSRIVLKLTKRLSNGKNGLKIANQAKIQNAKCAKSVQKR